MINKGDNKSNFGVDVAIRRADDLDKLMLDWVRENEVPKVLDLGSGAGGQSLRLVQAGADVTAIDITDYSVEFTKIRTKNLLTEESLKFFTGDIKTLDFILKNREFDIACLQRVIHYLPYQEAFNLLVYLRKKVCKKLYLSVTGLDSDIGQGYFDKNKPIESRFCRLEIKMAEKFYINEPICLYSKSEFQDLLIKAGWRIEKCWVSAFGNIKAVCN